MAKAAARPGPSSPDLPWDAAATSPGSILSISLPPHKLPNHAFKMQLMHYPKMQGRVPLRSPLAQPLQPASQREQAIPTSPS